MYSEFHHRIEDVALGGGGGCARSLSVQFTGSGIRVLECFRLTLSTDLPPLTVSGP